MKSFSDFCASLGCPLANTRRSWSALSRDGRRALFAIWADEVTARTYVLYPTTQRRPGEIHDEANSRPGAREIERIAAAVVQDPSIGAFGILSFAKDPKAETRVRASYDDTTVFRLRVVMEGGKYVAHLVERIAVRDIPPRAG